MNFEFSDDQKMIQEQARHFLSEQSTIASVRRVIDNNKTYDEELWQAIAELGWMGTAIPEAYGGLGMGHLELCVIAQELGRALSPVPFFSNVYIAAELFLACGNEEQKKNHLGAIANGSTIYCLAASEASGQPITQTGQCLVSNNQISGEKIAVLDGAAADIAIALAVDEAGKDVLVLVDLKQGTVKRSITDSLDQSRPLATLSFNNATCEIIGNAGEAISDLEKVLHSAAVLCSFEQIGGCEAVMDMGMEYCKQRFAFGRSIASFQAIKHKFADMYVALELARSNAYYAAWALHAGDAQLPLAAATARVSANEAYWFCSKENIEAHGGMGFTWEFDCHIYYKRAQLLSSVIGSGRWWKNELVNKLLEVA